MMGIKDIIAVIFVFYMFSMLIASGVCLFFLLNDKMVNILVFVIHVASAVTTQLL